MNTAEMFVVLTTCNCRLHKIMNTAEMFIVLTIQSCFSNT